MKKDKFDEARLDKEINDTKKLCILIISGMICIVVLVIYIVWFI